MTTKLPATCCSNVGGEGFFNPCGKPATKWYLHNGDVCSYCDRHNYVCGEPVLVDDDTGNTKK